MKKKQLIKQLQEYTYCRIMPSKIHGVGVFAIKNIPNGANIFIGSCQHKLISLTQNDMKNLDPEIKKIIQDFFINRNDKALVPSCAFNGIDISYYLNYSKTPNVKTDAKGEVLTAARDIKKGEELTINYEKDYKEKFIKG